MRMQLVRKERELDKAEKQVAEARAGLHALTTAAADLPAKEAELARTRSDLRQIARRRKRNSTTSPSRSSHLKLKRVSAKQVCARVRLRAQRGAALKATAEQVAKAGAELDVVVQDLQVQPVPAADHEIRVCEFLPPFISHAALELEIQFDDEDEYSSSESATNLSESDASSSALPPLS
ncbi:hypothetical protein EJB05_15281 [Eragrostis curvula]|uniref:Uncharacterized protein n=1 Tax=Eragrostis curvula TaxID=38414 RepID=A0A5J9W1H1_9POAL|nr:hypothetical protein EJB05_15281 [Eragrostis curvula]